MLDELSTAAGISTASPHGFTLLAVAERLFSERRLRDAAFPSGLFGEPAWDLLLLLFIAREQGTDRTVAELLRDAELAPGTGRRWIERLARAGLVAPRKDAARPTVRIVELTTQGIDRMSDYLARSAELQPRDRSS